MKNILFFVVFFITLFSATIIKAQNWGEMIFTGWLQYQPISKELYVLSEKSEDMCNAIKSRTAYGSAGKGTGFLFGKISPTTRIVLNHKEISMDTFTTLKLNTKNVIVYGKYLDFGNNRFSEYLFILTR